MVCLLVDVSVTSNRIEPRHQWVQMRLFYCSLLSNPDTMKSCKLVDLREILSLIRFFLLAQFAELRQHFESNAEKGVAVCQRSILCRGGYCRLVHWRESGAFMDQKRPFSSCRNIVVSPKLCGRKALRRSSPQGLLRANVWVVIRAPNTLNR